MAAFLAVNLVIIHVLHLTAGPSAHNGFQATGRLLGLYLAFAIVVQLLLVARLPLLDRRFGMDRLTGWHRWSGFAVFWLVLLHPAFVLLGFSRYDGVPLLRETVAFARQLPVALGMIAAGIIVVVAGFSLRAVRRRLSYEAWHAVHFSLYAVVVLATIHQVYEGTAFTTSIWSRIYWWGLWLFAVGALLTGRLVVPLIRNARHRLEVGAVVPESGGAVSVHVRGRDLERLGARPGQFFLWRFPGHNPWWQVNPFSLSAAPNSGSLRLTAKGVGSTSAGLRGLRVGTRVFAEGPYGALTADRRVREKTLLVAGGIGVTPIRALLEDGTLTDVVVLYRVRDEANAVLAGELRELAAARGARLVLLTGRTSPDNSPFEPERLAALVPDVPERDVFICGPAALTDKVRDTLRRLGVPNRQVHTELFRLA